MIQGDECRPRRSSWLRSPWLTPIRNSSELRGLYSRSYFGPRTCGGVITNVIVICLQGNGVILRTQKVIQGDDNGHVGRPCEVSLAPPCPELFCELLPPNGSAPHQESTPHPPRNFSFSVLKLTDCDNQRGLLPQIAPQVGPNILY